MTVAASGQRPAAMDDTAMARTPPALAAIQAETATLGFSMASEPKTGALLAALSAAKPGGRLLELGTGTGLGTAWLLSGMDASARLDTVDTDRAVVDVARRHLGGDARVAFRVEDGAAFLARADPDTYDLVYADAWPGKFTHLDAALGCIRQGGFYVIDDLLPQANWPDGHAEKVDALIANLEARPGFAVVRMAWASGLLLAVRQGPSPR
jgi:predicted O-methyltransferase YrrM